VADLTKDCLDAFTETENMGESEQYECPKCKTLKQATKKMTVMQAPQVFTLHLKRFRFDAKGRAKVETYVKFPTALNIERYMDDPQSKPYKLYGIIVHRGSSSSGHYVAHIYSNLYKCWFEMNDRSCKIVDEEKVLKERAYMLFYHQETRSGKRKMLDSPDPKREAQDARFAGG
jgi:ubiquitin C-terminal hydrolase